MDLGDYYTGRLSLRRLRILIKYLPGDAKLAKVVRARQRAAGMVTETSIEDADPSVWSQTEWLLVHLHDQLVTLNHGYLMVHRDEKKPKPPPPTYLPRPGAERPRRKTLNAWFGAVGLAPQRPART